MIYFSHITNPFQPNKGRIDNVLDDGKTVDFVEDGDSAVQFLRDYIANGGEVMDQQTVFIQDDDDALVL